MKINSTDGYKWYKSPIMEYVLYAIIIAFFVYFFLNVLFQLLIILVKIGIQYWYVSIGLILVIAFLKRRRGPKNDNT